MYKFFNTMNEDTQLIYWILHGKQKGALKLFLCMDSSNYVLFPEYLLPTDLIDNKVLEIKKNAGILKIYDLTTDILIKEDRSYVQDI